MNGFNMDDKNSNEAEKIKVFDQDDDSPSPNNSTSKDESVTIKGQNFIKISHSKERLFNIIDSTSEEEGDIIWRPEEKEAENHLFSSEDDGLGKTQRREIPTRGARSHSTRRIRKNNVNRKYPMHYYIMFYGLPILIIIILGVLVILRYKSLQNTKPPEKSNEAKIWSIASQKVRNAVVKENFAIDAKDNNNNHKAIIQYRKAAVLYTEAIAQGKELIGIQIKLEKQKRNLTNEQARKYVSKEYKYYVNSVKTWEKNLNRIIEEIQKLED